MFAYTADLKQANHYYPFGMVMPGRSYSSGEGYRFSFQGQETDDEVRGEGNSVFFKYRVYDPRIGRFASVDPLSADYPFYSPYNFSGNRVIDMVELEGREPTSAQAELMLQDSAALEKATYGREIEHANIYKMQGIHSGDKLLQWASDMYVAEVPYTDDSGNDFTSWYYLDKDLNRWLNWDRVREKETQQVINLAYKGFYYSLAGTAAMEAFGARAVGEEVIENAIDEATGMPISAVRASIMDIDSMIKAYDDMMKALKKNNVTVWKLTKSRPNHRVGARDKVFENASDGKSSVTAPFTGETITKDSDWVMGHKPGYEYKHLLKAFKEGRINKKQFDEYYHNPKYYEPRTSSSNSKHLGEEDKSRYDFDN